MFAKLRKATASFLMSVCLSVRMEKLRSHWTDFYEVLRLIIFRKYEEKIQVSLNSDKNNGYLTQRPMYIYTTITFSSS
jgi:hypothetical protein